MLKRKVLLTVVVLAAIAGVAAGRYYASAITGVAWAENSQPTPPEWKELRVLYLGSAGTAVSNKEFDPAVFAAGINAQVISDATEAIKISRIQGLDVFILDRSALASVDRVWAAAQYKRGTAFVGLNVTPRELGALINDPFFANSPGRDATLASPFLSFTFVKVIGNPRHIKLLEEAGILYPPDIEAQDRMGIYDVFLSFGNGYGPLNGQGLQGELENIRMNLDSHNPVKPW